VRPLALQRGQFYTHEGEGGWVEMLKTMLKTMLKIAQKARNAIQDFGNGLGKKADLWEGNEPPNTTAFAL